MSKDVLEEVRSELVQLRELVKELAVKSGERQRLFQFKEAAKLLGVHHQTVSRMVASGELVTVRLRGKSLIPVEEIDRICTPPKMKSSGATEERARFDGTKALAELAELRKKRKR